jgi:hypothetical protein
LQVTLPMFDPSRKARLEVLMEAVGGALSVA